MQQMARGDFRDDAKPMRGLLLAVALSLPLWAIVAALLMGVW